MTCKMPQSEKRPCSSVGGRGGELSESWSGKENEVELHEFVCQIYLIFVDALCLYFYAKVIPKFYLTHDTNLKIKKDQILIRFHRTSNSNCNLFEAVTHESHCICSVTLYL